MEQESVELPSMTYAELLKFNGTASEKVYFSLKGIKIPINKLKFENF